MSEDRHFKTAYGEPVSVVDAMGGVDPVGIEYTIDGQHGFLWLDPSTAREVAAALLLGADAAAGNPPEERVVTDRETIQTHWVPREYCEAATKDLRDLFDEICDTDEDGLILWGGSRKRLLRHRLNGMGRAMSEWSRYKAITDKAWAALSEGRKA
jgi:hypothetical protein